MSGSLRESDLVERLVEEFIERERRGDRPTIEEYEVAHPDVAVELRKLLEAVAFIRDLKPGSSDAAELHGNRSAATADGWPPERFGDYRSLREVGRGGMGIVYEAEQESLGRRVALKILPRPIARDRHSLERFRREARSAARLHHTNIVPIFEVGQDGETVFYAMQY